jgi:hypothetical protein
VLRIAERFGEHPERFALWFEGDGCGPGLRGHLLAYNAVRTREESMRHHALVEAMRAGALARIR